MVALKPDSPPAALMAMLFSESHTRLRISIPAGVEGAHKMTRNVCLRPGLLPKVPANNSKRRVSPGGQTGPLQPNCSADFPTFRVVTNARLAFADKAICFSTPSHEPTEPAKTTADRPS